MDNSLDLFAPLSKKQRALLEKKEPITPSNSFLKETWINLKKNSWAIFGLISLATLIIFSLFGPLLSTYTYDEIRLSLKNEPPTRSFWFGTDELGRDLFIRCCWGTRISLFVGFTASLIDLVIGVFYGGIAGLYGGKKDEWMMRIADILYSIPYLMVVILLMVFLGQGLLTIILALTFTGWINMARIVRSQVLQTKHLDFILAAYAIGASQKRILLYHLIPNAIGPIIVTLTLTVPSAIFTEAFLSFLGLGVQAPIASLGTMANDGLPALRYFPWRLFFPACLVSWIILSFNILGDGLRDALDPRFKK